jgi:hypothetical protein
MCFCNLLTLHRVSSVLPLVLLALNVLVGNSVVIRSRWGVGAVAVSVADVVRVAKRIRLVGSYNHRSISVNNIEGIVVAIGVVVISSSLEECEWLPNLKISPSWRADPPQCLPACSSLSYPKGAQKTEKYKAQHSFRSD